MTREVLIINGAARPRGNTDALLARLAAGARRSGLNPLTVELRRKRIANCTGCYQCRRSATCSLRDDMSEIRAGIEGTDLMVLASPLYWYGVTGLMKTFIDRLFSTIIQTRGRVSRARRRSFSPP